MKVLIAINNDAVSEAIGNYYQREYGEVLEVKNVYYFKALHEELKHNVFDRIIIHEELEPFSTTNQEIINNNLFEVIDKISDDAHDAEIIFICSDLRKRDDKLVRRMFNIGVYNCLIGEDRNVEEVVRLLNSPREKKEAKSYIDYDLEEDVYGKEEEVDETELNRILMAYENAGEDENRYVEIFEKISEQYTDIQLKVIATFLPERVKKVLLRRCEKFKSIYISSSPYQHVEKQNIDTFKDEGKEQFKDSIKTQEKQENIFQDSSKKPTEQQFQQVPVINENLPKIQKVTEVIEKEIIREVYETPKDYRKVVCFVGAHKVGVTFTINAIAAYLTRKGVKTAIIDATKNKDTYFVYAMNNETNREIAANSLLSLAKGKDSPLEVNRTSIYTSIPGQLKKENIDYMKMIEIAKEKHSVVLIDCDFDSSLELFKICQNIYAIQDMDILKLQPLTSFLRELKYRGVSLEKVKVVINKHIKCGLPAKRVIEGISYYSNPEMTIYDELFVKSINYYILPFNENNYKKYIEGLYLCKVNYGDFTEDFKEALEQLVASIYPIGPSKSKVKNFKNIFSSIKTMISVNNKSDDDDHSGVNKITI